MKRSVFQVDRGSTAWIWQALVRRTDLRLREQSQLQALLGGRESQDRAGDQGGDDDGRGRVQVPGGLQELPHQEHEAQPDCSG